MRREIAPAPKPSVRYHGVVVGQQMWPVDLDDASPLTEAARVALREAGRTWGRIWLITTGIEAPSSISVCGPRTARGVLHVDRPVAETKRVPWYECP